MNESKVSTRAVIVSLTDDPEGVRISLDDIVQNENMSWTKDRHVTSQVFSAEKIADSDFTEKELADIGHYVIARLRALRKVWGTK